VGGLLAEYLSPAQFGALFRSSRFWALYSLAAFPLVVLALEPNGTASWMFVYFSLVWAVLFFRLIQPERGTARAAIGVYFLTVFAAMPLLVVWLSLPPHLTEAFLEAGGLFRLVGFVLGVGVREEATKLLPLLYLLFLARRRGVAPLSLRQGIALGAVAGFAFAAAENVEYLRAFEAWDRLAVRYGVFSRTSLDASLVRMMLTPFMHGAWAGIAGYFAAWGEWNPDQRWRLRAAGVLGAAILHGTYDTVAPYPVLTLVAVAFTFHVFTRCVARATHEASGVAALERGAGLA
jgi:RsiW-degrading membrane proteinase PrsW (M82 family)